MNVSHSHIRTKKRSLPNLHVVTVIVDGKRQPMRLCTKCTRIVRKKYPYNAEPVANPPAGGEKKVESKENEETEKEKASESTEVSK